MYYLKYYFYQFKNYYSGIFKQNFKKELSSLRLMSSAKKEASSVLTNLYQEQNDKIAPKKATILLLFCRRENIIFPHSYIYHFTCSFTLIF